MASGIVAVIGGGTMGNGIAEAFAVAGYSVRIYDVSEQVCQNGLRAIQERLEKRHQRGRLNELPETVCRRIESIGDLKETAGVELVVEAIVERLDVKQSVFRTIDLVCPPSTILATNTSSLSVTEIAVGTKYPGRIVGMHFFNPAPVMPLVEVVVGRNTETAVVNQAMTYAESIGKTPIRVTDTPSFIVNRVARPFYNEAVRIVGEQTATIAQVDRILKGAGFRMGPFELQDLIGIDINYATTSSTYAAFFQDARFRPHPFQRMMVQAGTLGRKTGRGYYEYDRP